MSLSTEALILQELKSINTRLRKLEVVKPQKQWLTEAEVMTEFGIGKSTLQRYRRTGKVDFKGRRTAKQLRGFSYSRESLEALYKENK